MVYEAIIIAGMAVAFLGTVIGIAELWYWVKYKR